MKLLDLFCGLGGWSNGFDKCGFQCTGVDIVNVGYSFELILASVLELNTEKLKGKFDVIVGSPPCRDFSKICNIGQKRWKIKPCPENGLILVHAFIKIVNEVNPPYWILENVPKLDSYINLEPQIKGKISDTQYRYFWGEFPPPLLPFVNSIRVDHITGKFSSWKRAKIPTPISEAFAKAILSDNK